MRPARTTMPAVLAATAVIGLGTVPAAFALGTADAYADGIVVSPGSPHAGEKIHISVPDCSVGPTSHTARSDAFQQAVTLFGKADTGEGDPRIKKGLGPGTYPITADCGDGRIVHGQVTVAAGSGGDPGESAPPATTAAPRTITATPAASRGGDSSSAYWLAGAAATALLGVAALLSLRRRGRS